MKKIAISLWVVSAVVLTTMLACCSHESSVMDYTVTIILDNTLHHDSATLLVMEEEYNQLRLIESAAVKNGELIFTGQIDKPKVAVLRWDNDSTKPFHFVLESGATQINISASSWSSKGSKLNAEYMSYVNQRNNIMNARVATWQEYLKMAADSSLKRDDERLMVQQDSLLNDSLQRITVERINRGDVVGRIIREHYGQQLDREHMRMIK